ncbi:hypothetical protein EUX98_g7426 [Antrodiella citrinella]|uniref:Uncharacterized protein n=1 Tax=Antrodiella citrinella TaxID=2447956 RepID=A0A4S4MLJ5_9APHY|nr:hypothetical protein EUX98_g7426 [Antrodiella citrinella]
MFSPLSVHQASKKEGKRHSTSTIPIHVPHYPLAPEPANDDDLDVVHTDLESLVEDTDEDDEAEVVLDFNDIPERLGEMSDLTNSTNNTDSEDAEEDADVPIVRNGSVDYGSIPPAQYLDQPALEHDGVGQIVPLEQEDQKPADPEQFGPVDDAHEYEDTPVIPRTHHQEPREPPPVAGPSRIRSNVRKSSFCTDIDTATD